MLCVRCGSPNPGTSKSCTSCGSILPRDWSQNWVRSTLDLQDGRHYDPPDRSYPNTALTALAEALDEYFEGNGQVEPIWESIEELECRLAGLLQALPVAQQAIEHQKDEDPDDLPHQIGYLLQTGVNLFNQALEMLVEAVERNRDENYDSALEQLQLGNDYICHSAQLVSQLFAREGQTVELQADEGADSNDLAIG